MEINIQIRIRLRRLLFFELPDFSPVGWTTASKLPDVFEIRSFLLVGAAFLNM